VPLAFTELTDRDTIESWLRREAATHVYPIADLDDVFWPDTRWFGAVEGSRIRAICLVLEGLRIPIVYAVCAVRDAAMRALLREVGPELPDRFFYNLGCGLPDALEPAWTLAPHGTYWKMALDANATLPASREAPTRIETLLPRDYDELRAFLDDDAYRGDEKGGLFFERPMLDSGFYRGVRDAGRLIAAGGVHVYSARYGVAALGNIVARPLDRGRGLGRALTAAVCRDLRRDLRREYRAGVPTIGLNVMTTNAPGIRCYERLGFSRLLPYEEGIAERP
jgi:ribosomal protein S18 acetylase RimI-like enzyme